MSATAVANRVVRSTLNPNAPLFIPAAFQQVEDFSPQWWELVKSSTWFRDHWIQQNQDQETFESAEEDDVVDLLPDSFDLDIAEEFSNLEAEYDEADFYQPYTHVDFASMKKESLGTDVGADAAALIKSLSLKSPRNGGMMRPGMEQTKYKEKPLQCVSPKLSPRHTIHQPR